MSEGEVGTRDLVATPDVILPGPQQLLIVLAAVMTLTLLSGVLLRLV